MMGRWHIVSKIMVVASVNIPHPGISICSPYSWGKEGDFSLQRKEGRRGLSASHKQIFPTRLTRLHLVILT
jgi:hypothetical protein